jgi:hypothetical protein
VLLVGVTDVSEALASSLTALKAEAANISETSVNFYKTTPHDI